MTGQLFRQEVLTHQGEKFWGECLDMHPLSMSVLTILLLSLFITLGWFLATGDYQRKEVVSGVLVSDKGAVKIRSPASGTVEALLFGQGEWVGKGESLLEVRSARSAIVGTGHTEEMIAENIRQADMLKKLLQMKREAFPERLEQMDLELFSLEDKKEQLVILISNEAVVNELVGAKIKRFSELFEKHHVSIADLDMARMEGFKQENKLHQARMELESNKRLLEKTKYEKALLNVEFKQQIAELEKQLSELRKQNLKFRGEQAFNVLSPVSGTITVVLSQQGQTVLEQQPLLSVLQDGSTLEAELYVPSRAAGFLETGQLVRLRFDAFPYQKFGTLKARVKEISRSVLLPEDIQDTKGINEPFFKVVASLEASHIDAYEKKIMLRPGMQLNANIVLENRSLIEWILEPLYIHRRHG